jgi:hypothetical protein
VMDTENIDDPFKHAKVGDQVIVGPRSMMVFSDSTELMQKLNDPTEPKPPDPRNPGVARK